MSGIVLSAALKSGKGRVRKNNEDACYFNGWYAELKDMDREITLQEQIGDSRALFALCDGIGGADNGEAASYAAVSRLPLLRDALRSAGFAPAVTQWTGETNTVINETEGCGGCTLVLLYADAGELYIAHIGDSRVYRFRGGILSRMTKDHSKLQVLLDAGIITEEEAETYPQKHVITRSLGMDEEEMGKCIPAVQGPLPAEDADRYMICTDGVTDMLTDARIGQLLSEGKTAMDCAEAVYQAALDAGGKDNTSVMLIDIEKH